MNTTTRVLAAILAAACASSACGADPETPSAAPTATSTAAPSANRPDHVLVVVMENKPYDRVVGTTDAPYITQMTRMGANLTNSYAVTHPSQPNYIALLSGSTHGVTDDSCPQDFGDAPNLARQVLDTGLTFVAYSEALPSPDFSGCSSPDGLYQRKHAPWADFNNVPAGTSQPFTQLPADYSALPTLSFVIPNMCNDMHDCPIDVGDKWLRDHMDAYAQWATTHNSVLMVTFDEDDYHADNHIPTMLIGQGIKPGDHTEHVDHYTILRTLEDWYGLPPLGEAAQRQGLTALRS